MARLRKQRRNKKFNYTKDRKRNWKNKKKLKKITCATIQEAWDRKKSMERNMQDMGLSSDVNQTIRIPKTKEFLTQLEDVVMTTKEDKPKGCKQYVAEELEIEANLPREKKMDMSDPNVKFCVYMMEKYQDNFKAMARDPRNHFQDTPKQIKRKINKFKNTSTQYADYLRSKGEKVMDTS